MHESQIKLVYKKPTDYDNSTIISINNDNIDLNLDDDNSYNLIDENIQLLPKQMKSHSYLDKFDNILNTTDTNDGLFYGIVFLIIIIIIMTFYKKII